VRFRFSHPKFPKPLEPAGPPNRHEQLRDLSRQWAEMPLAYRAHESSYDRA
jgi:hypothetical protein